MFKFLVCSFGIAFGAVVGSSGSSAVQDTLDESLFQMAENGSRPGRPFAQLAENGSRPGRPFAQLV